ncbi:MFS transporter [Flindersiella endophytica]
MTDQIDQIERSDQARAAAATPRSRWIALLLLCAGSLMMILDGNIVTVALPSIQADLGFDQSSLAWVVNAYLIPFGGLLLLSGRLGDLLGRKRMFVAGLAVFTLASLLCGLATTPALLIAARFAQGAGGAMVSAVALGMIVALFPDGRERAKAIGVYAFVGSAGASIGALAGGVLTQWLSWHWIFYVNLPIGVAVAGLAGWYLSSDRGLGLREGADGLGALLVTGGLMLGVYTIVETTTYGWVSAHTLGFGLGAVALLAGFVLRQARAAKPLLPLRLFRSRGISAGNLVQTLMVAAMFGFQFLVALYVQHVLRFDAGRTGLAFLPITLTIGIFSLGFSARLINRFGVRFAVLAGLALLGAGLGWLARVPVDGRYLTDVLPVLVVLGVGAGLALPAVTSLAMSDVAGADAGLASGVLNTTQQVGGALGLSVLATLATGRTDLLLASGVARAAALTGGYQLAFGIGAALLAAAIVLTLVAVPGRRRSPHNAG